MSSLVLSLNISEKHLEFFTKVHSRLENELVSCIINYLRNALESPGFLQKSTVDSKMSLLVISLNRWLPNSKMLHNKDVLNVVLENTITG